MSDSILTRVGIFYDGNYFLHVSNYYAFSHLRRARINVSGLHNYIRRKVAECEGADERYCQIVDAHYFRGRLRAYDADERDMLLKERVFDDILSREGVTSHYLPLGPFGEKGIDVWLALEAYELAIYKKFDVTVLITGDGDFLPLVRKLNTLGTRVMLLSWDFKYFDKNGTERETKTSQSLLEEATYPIPMHHLIGDGALSKDPMINGLFAHKTEQAFPALSSSFQEMMPPTSAADITHHAGDTAVPQKGYIENLKEGYGFISPEDGGENLFFFHSEVLNADFNDLQIDDPVSYHLGENAKGICAVRVRILEEDIN